MTGRNLQKARGRRAKNSVFSFSTRAYYYAVQHYASVELGRPVTTADLIDMFDQFLSDDGHVFYNFREGISLPTLGRYGNKERLDVAIHERFPQAAAWRDHTLWSALEHVELTERQIHALMWRLPITVRCTLMTAIGEVGVQRYWSYPEFEMRTIVEHRSLDALVAAVLLVREAELLQDQDRWQCAKQAMSELLPTLRANPWTGQPNFAMAPFADEVVDYIEHTFASLWLIIAGFYSGEP